MSIENGPAPHGPLVTMTSDDAAREMSACSDQAARLAVSAQRQADRVAGESAGARWARSIPLAELESALLMSVRDWAREGYYPPKTPQFAEAARAAGYPRDTPPYRSGFYNGADAVYKERAREADPLA